MKVILSLDAHYLTVRGSYVVLGFNIPLAGGMVATREGGQ